jgi:UDP-2-acetamido-3-amino-2,3-dideoxy-glucuronate N-acetyltransferase
MQTFIHPTAIIEDGVSIGAGTAIWDHTHVRHDTTIGEQCLIGEKVYIAYGVRVGNRVKIQNFSHISTGVTIEDGVMVCIGTVFTNELYPRATTPDLRTLLPSEPTGKTLSTLVREGATLGASTVLRGGITIGRFAMVGFGSLVTRSVPDFHLVTGQPAALVGCVCRCGQPVARFKETAPLARAEHTCAECRRRYVIDGLTVTEVSADR